MIFWEIIFNITDLAKICTIFRRWSMCNDIMPVSVKVYFGPSSNSAVEIRRFIFRPEQIKVGTTGVYHALLDRIRALFNGLNLYDVHLCWKGTVPSMLCVSSKQKNAQKYFLIINCQKYICSFRNKFFGKK